jgi:pyruvate/2-oxoglutarate dehydrogenase complex dihydrolipoamide acyltransferase (E2) component
VVLREAEKMDAAGFVKQVNTLHKRALTTRLGIAELSGASVGFSSMSRWSASRHIPILPPHVSLMVAHTISRSGEGILGATYDHRLLHGGDTIGILNALAIPPVETETA